MEGGNSFLAYSDEIGAIALSIEGESKKIFDCVTNTSKNDEHEDALVNLAKSVAKETSTLLRLQPPETDNVTRLAQIRLLRNAGKGLSGAVLKLINSAKAAADNPFDYQTKQDVSNNCREVEIHIKAVRGAAETLNMKLETTEEALKQQQATCDQANEAADMLRKSLQTLESSVVSGDKNGFLAEARTSAKHLGSLLEIATSLELTEQRDNIKEASLSLITSGKVALKNPSEQCITQLKLSKKRLEDEVNLTVIGIQSKLYSKASPLPPTTTKPATAPPSIPPKPERRPAFRAPLGLSVSQMGPFKPSSDPADKKIESGISRRATTLAPKKVFRGEDVDKRRSFPAQTEKLGIAKEEASNIVFTLETKYKVKIPKKHKSDIIQHIENRLVDLLSKENSGKGNNNSQYILNSERKDEPDLLKLPRNDSSEDPSKSEEDDVQSDLQKIEALENYAEWRKMTMSRKNAQSIKRKSQDVIIEQEDFLDPHTKINAKQGAVRLKKLGTETSEIALDFIVTANEAMLKPDSGNDRLGIAAGEFLAALKKVITLGLSLAQSQKTHQTTEKIILAALAFVTQQPTKGVLDKNCLEAASSFEAKMLDSNLQRKVYISSNAVRVLSLQLLSAISTVCSNPKGHGIHLILSTTAKALSEAIVSLLNFVETSKYLSQNKHKYSSTTAPIKSIEILDMFSNNEASHIWAENQEEEMKKIIYDKDHPEDVSAASLNNLIRILTSVDTHDFNFRDTFITTYQSFTTPRILFDKLLERYTIPEESNLNEETKKAIKIRVSIIIKYWVENQFFDLDEELVQKVFSFVDETLRNDGFNDFANILKVELNKKISERMHQKNLMFTPPSELNLVSQKALKEIFMNSSDLDIAKQLTLIDFSLYSRIEPSGLLNQAWNKPKLQYRSPDILAMISRANKVSFWVACMTLWQEKGKDRKKVIEKFIGIADNLKKLKNFHTLMGIIAGLNTASVTRLKEAKASVSSKALQTFNKLEQLMHPKSSFKSYREYLHSQSTPCLPYLGTYLTDLTFIEDGNPDHINDLIGFSKRRLIQNVIFEVKNYQHTPYDIKEQEPLYTFLAELPTLSEKELYSLSLQREVRQSSGNVMVVGKSEG